MIFSKTGRSAAGVADGHKNDFGQGAPFIPLHQDKVQIAGERGQDRCGRRVPARDVRHLKEARGSQGHGPGAGLPETPGIFAGLVDFQQSCGYA